MSKRLTDSEKWDDPWFRSLNPVMKCVWYFLCDKCDNAGVWKKDFELMRFYIGSPIEDLSVLAVFNGNGDKRRIIELGTDKWLICKFASFQYKNNPKMFNHINTLCQKHGLDINTLFIGYQYPMDTAMNKNKVKVKVKKEAPQLPNKDQFLSFVFLTKEEYAKLIAKFGEEGTKKRIYDLNNGIGSKGYKYKSHYHTILSWENKNARDEKSAIL